MKLSIEIINEGLEEVIKAAPGSSTTGPDGIPFQCYKRFAAVLTPILGAVIKESCQMGSLPCCMMEANIVLFSKKMERPIIGHTNRYPS